MTLAGVVALTALATVLASLTFLHLAPTGLSPIHNAVSQYGITPFRAGYRVATLAFAAAAIALAVGINHEIGSRASAVVVLLAIFAGARGVISWFPMDAPGAPRTQTGQIHGIVAIVAFVGVTVAAFKLANVLSRGTHGTSWHALAPVSTALGALMAVFLVGMALARSYPAVRENFGAVERGFYIAAISWFGVFSVALVANAH